MFPGSPSLNASVNELLRAAAPRTAVAAPGVPCAYPAPPMGSFPLAP